MPTSRQSLQAVQRHADDRMARIELKLKELASQNQALIQIVNIKFNEVEAHFNKLNAQLIRTMKVFTRMLNDTSDTLPSEKIVVDFYNKTQGHSLRNEP